MKKIYFILIPLILIVFIAGSTLLLSQNKLQKLAPGKEILKSSNKKNNASSENLKEHIDKNFNCKTCHLNEYPTKLDPGLRSCPRNSMTMEFPSSKEGPDVVNISDMSDHYSGVKFSHKIHAQMSEMSVGCTGCHHYNTSGPVLSCKECHENSRMREDVSVPDLKAAYHRQCLSCHKQWSHENGCSTQCHSLKGSENQIVSKTVNTDKTHPVLKEPEKLTWKTNSEAGKIVTFFHNEHNQLFKISCKTCHGQDNCVMCHEKKVQQENNSAGTEKSFDENHRRCIKCHEGNTCDNCHSDKELSPFNHSKTAGWTLKSYHSNLSCAKCHGNALPFRRLDNNCTSCHKNFLPGKFDHKLTGLVLSENHKEFECNNCHIDNNFSKQPQCKMCHDDKSFPSQIPGKR